MNDLSAQLLKEWQTHPAAQLDDLFKFCYQAAFGPGHLLTDPAAAEAFLLQEWQNTPAPAGGITPLGTEYARLSIGAAKAAGVNSRLYFAIFACSASAPLPDGAARFEAAAAQLTALCAARKLPFTKAEAEAFYQSWAAGDKKPFSHSDAYKKAYAPAYRVVKRELAEQLPLLKKASELAQSGGVIAIERRCGSGKTTLAAELSDLFGAPVVHMDDFFLPFEKRTPQRYAQPGGNLDYERFAKEVLPYLKSKKPFVYGAFSCRTGQVERQVRVKAAPLLLVEGAYAMHPAFGHPYDLTVFCDVKPKVQEARILQRNGQKMWQTFKTRWILMEDQYFSACDIRSRCDFVLYPGQIEEET